MQDAYGPVLWLNLNLAVTSFAPFSPVGLERGNDVCLINNDIHDAGHQKSSKHIKHGMLLDKHGGQDDGNTKHKGADTDIFLLGKALVMDNSQMSTDGSAFNLGGASSGDTMGRGGVAAYLDKQLWNKYGNPVLSAMAESFLISVSPASGEVGASSASTGNISGRAKKQQEIRDIWTGLGEDILDKMIEDADAVPPFSRCNHYAIFCT